MVFINLMTICYRLTGLKATSIEMGGLLAGSIIKEKIRGFPMITCNAKRNSL
jgi:hypothetical protein